MNLNKFLLVLTGSLFLILGSFNEAKASHAMGLDIAYKCLGNDSFLISLNFYRDCDGIAAPTSKGISIASRSGCGTPINLTLTRPSVTTNPFTGATVPNGSEISAVCADDLANTTCNGGNLQGVEIYTYTGIVVLNAQCPDWIISFTECCRNPAITNLTSPSSNNLYVEALLNNSGGLCNNSPVFTASPVPYELNCARTCYSPGLDSDGDSLVFSSINPLTNATTLIPYVSPFSPSQPLNTTGPFILDSHTGQMVFTSNGQQNAVITILVEEYRNGVLIGTTMRDMQVVVANIGTTITDCSAPSLSGAINSTVPVVFDSFVFCNAVTKLVACPGNIVSFEFFATDTSALTDTLIMTSSKDQNPVFTNASFAITILDQDFSDVDSVLGTFSWIPSLADTGKHSLVVRVESNLCPIPTSAISVVEIEILAATSAGPDRFYCPAGGPVQLNAEGGSVFTWTPSDSLSDPGIRNPFASPSVTTDYIVTSDLDSSLCKNRDTARVYVVPDFILSISPDDSICRNSATLLNVQGDNVWAPYTYSWTPAANLTDPSIYNPVATPKVTTTYQVAVTSDTGCTIKDSVTVHIIGVGPIVEITTDKNHVCPGDTAQLSSVIYPLECGPSISGCSINNQPVARTLGTGATGTSFFTPFYAQGGDLEARYQVLYRASDLIALGMNAGTITRLEFDIGSKASSFSFSNFTIRMGCTDNTSLSLVRGWEDASTEVYAPLNYPTSLGPNNFALTTPYDWDGSSNIVIEMCYNSMQGDLMPGGSDELVSFVPSPAYTGCMRSSSANIAVDGCILNPQFVTTDMMVPKITFFICDPLPKTYTYTWSPATNLSDAIIADPQATITGPITYTLFVDDSVCDGAGTITLLTDTIRPVVASEDVTICKNNAAQLGASYHVYSPRCGVNGSPCSQSTIRTVGNGTSLTPTSSTSTITPTPYFGFYTGARVQYIFRASELIAAGLEMGPISSVAFNVGIKNSGGFGQPNFAGFTIKMKCTNSNSLAGFEGGAVPVFGPRLVVTSSGWNTHSFDNNFDWDGTSNLLVEVCFDNGTSNWSLQDQVFYTNTNYISTYYDFADAFGDECMLPGNISRTSTNRPNIRFSNCPAIIDSPAISWSPPGTLSNPASDSPVATPSSTTQYYVTAAYTDGCVFTDSVIVNIIDIQSTISSDTSICKFESVQLFATGGDSYLWDSIPGLSCYNCPNPVATPNSTTTYVVTVTDSTFGCDAKDSVTITVYDLPFIRFSNDSLTCFLDSLILNAGGGFSDYTWNDNSKGQTIVVAIEGTYSVTVTDVNGCINSDSIAVRLNNSPRVELGNDTSVCNGAAVTINAGSGYAGYLWTTGENDSMITVFATGDYTVTVADTNGCPAMDTLTVTVLPPVSLGNDTFLCTLDTLALIAGPSIFDFIWSDSSNASSIMVFNPGKYSVTVTDTLGCISFDSILVSYYPDNSAQLGNDTGTCNNVNILLTPGSGYVSYAWSNGALTPAIGVSALGNYSVTVVDMNGCRSSDTVNVNDGTPSIDIGPGQNICDGTPTTIHASPGFEFYLWNDPNQTTDSILVVTTGGTYSVTVTDDNGCSATDITIFTASNSPEPDLGLDGNTCPGFRLNPGNFEAYLWHDDSDNPTFSVTTSGIYSVTVTDANGCTATDTVDLAVVDLILLLPNPILCTVDDSVIITGTEGFEFYFWSTGDSTQTITVFEPGTYELTAIDANGCIGEAASEVELDQLLIETSATPALISEGDESQLFVEPFNGSGDYVFNWSPVETLNDPSIQSPLASPAVNTTYFVSVTDLETECTKTDTVNLLVESNYVAPSAFTPDGLPPNNTYGILTSGVTVIEFKIYNRWGELVHNDVNPWDGTFNGTEQPTGTYVFHAVVELANGDRKPLSNAFSLLR